MNMQEVNVRVAVRVRPLLEREQIAGEQPCVTVLSDSDQILVGKDRLFAFDFVFGPDSTQEELYSRSVQQLVTSCFDGYNVTVFAYGQTGSGKTYTIGANPDAGLMDEELGIVPRAVRSMFAHMQKSSSSTSAMSRQPVFRVKVAYLELYMEELRDLLDPAHSTDINIREDEQGNTVVTGMREIPCTSPDEVLYCLQHGSAVRRTGATQMNEHSSRSHSIFTITVEQQWCLGSEESEQSMVLQDASGKYEFTTGKFHFVDLAGSERAYRTGNVGDRFKESIYINTGLLSLGNVISALGDAKKKAQHVPYRDSKITRLLKDSLGGNAKTLMVCCISPATCNFDETLNALKYANRARNIKNKPIVNRDKQSKKLEEMQNELEALRRELRKRDFVTTDDGVPAQAVVFDFAERQLLQDRLVTCQAQCASHLVLLEAAAVRLFEVNSAELNGVRLPESLATAVRSWLEAWESANSKQLLAVSGRSTISANVKEDAVSQLQQEVEKCRNELKGDEKIFAEQSQMISSLQKDVSKLASEKVMLESQLRNALDHVSELELAIHEQQHHMDELCHQKGEHEPFGGTNSLSLEQSTNLASGRRAKSVPAARRRNDEGLSRERDVHTSPALFSLERVMQNFRAQSRMLVEQLDDEDEVAHQVFSDDESDSGKKQLRDSSHTRTVMHPLRTSYSNASEPPMQRVSLFYEPGAALLQVEPENAVDLDKQQRMILETKRRSQEVNNLLRDLNINIRMKEQLIRQMVKNEHNTGEVVKKYADQVRQLAEEKEQAQRDLGDLQKEFQKLELKGNGSSGNQREKLESEYQKRIESAKRRLNALQSKQLETEKIAGLSAQHEQRISELQIAISRMRQQQEELQKRLREEHEKKEKLERDMTKETQKLKQLEAKTSRQEKLLRIKTEEAAAAQRKLRSGSSMSVSNGVAIDNQKKWIDNEIEKLVEQRLQMELLQKELEMREQDVHKREAILTERSELEMKKLRASQVVSKELVVVSARLDKLNSTVPSQAPVIDEVAGVGSKMTLQTERDKLLQQKAHLDKKLTHDRLLSAKEERRLLELNEALEALDAAIDYKSELISSHQAALSRSQVWVQSEDNLMSRLKSLNAAEAQNLLTKFFGKVVDLKEKLHSTELRSRESEICLAELGQQLQAADAALQTVQAEAERELLQQQQDYEDKLAALVSQLLCEQRQQLLLQQARPATGSSAVTGGTSAAAPVESREELLQKDLYYYKKTCRDLKKRVRELTQQLGSAGDNDVSVSVSASSVLGQHSDQSERPPAPPSNSSLAPTVENPARGVAAARLSHDAPLREVGHHRHHLQNQAQHSSTSPGYLGSDGYHHVKLSRKDLRPMTAEEVDMRRSGASIVGGRALSGHLQSPRDSLDAA